METQTAVFWLLRPYKHYRVICNGIVRADFDEIWRPRDGAVGILFDALTYEERCSVHIQEVVRPPSVRA